MVWRPRRRDREVEKRSGRVDGDCGGRGEKRGKRRFATEGQEWRRGLALTWRGGVRKRGGL